MRGMASPTNQDTFESFPLVFDEEEEATAGTLTSKLKRFFRLPAVTPPSTSPAPSPALEGAQSSSGKRIEVSSRVEAENSRIKPPHSERIPFPAEDSIPEGSVAPVRLRDPRIIQPEGGRRPRSIRLSGVSPSVRLSFANSQLGEVVQSSASSFSSDNKFGEERDRSGGSIYGSPSGSEAVGHLSHIPGFPINTGDDARSIRSVTTTSLKPMSSSVVGVFRKLRGEVRCFFLPR